MRYRDHRQSATSSDANPDSPSPPRRKKISYLKLEERRVLNATFAFDLMSAELTLDNFVDSDPGDNTIEISQSGSDFTFQLQDGSWSAMGSVNGLTFVLSDGDSLLTVQNGNTQLDAVQLVDSTTDTFDIVFGDLSFGSGDVSIVQRTGTFDSVSQVETSTLITNEFNVQSNSIDLSNASNDFNSFAGTASGDIAVTDANAIQLPFLLTDDGSVMVTAAGNIDVLESEGLSGILISDVADTDAPANSIELVSLTGNVSTAGVVSNQSGGEILIQSGGLDGDITVSSDIFAEVGDIRLESSDSIVVDNASSITSFSDGDVVFIAGVFGGGDDNGEIRLTDSTTLDAANGAIAISNVGSSGGDIFLSQLTTLNASSTAVDVESDGMIVDSTSNETANIRATNGGIQLRASVAIGSDGLADIDIDALHLAWQTNGRAVITDLSDGLTIESTADIAMSQALAGGIVTTVGGPLIIQSDIVVGGNTNFVASGTAEVDDDIVISDLATVTLDADVASLLNFVAGDDIRFETGRVVTQGGPMHTVFLAADIEVFDDEDSGSITNTASGPTATVSTNRVVLGAADGIGDSSGLDAVTDVAFRTQVDSIVAINDQNNAIRISEATSVDVDSLFNIGRIISFSANGNILDGDAGADNLDVQGGQVTISSGTGSIGSANNDIFKGAFNPLEIIAGESVVATASNGVVAANALENINDGTLSGQSIVIVSDGDLNADSAFDVLSIQSDNLALIADADNDGDGTLLLSTPLSVAQDLRLEGHEISSFDGQPIQVSATRLFLSTDTTLQVEADVQLLDIEFDSAVSGPNQTNNQELLVNNAAPLTLVDLNCDSHSIVSTNDDIKVVADGGINIVDRIALSAGAVFLGANGDLSQASGGTITADGLSLMVTGATTLQASNEVNVFAAANGGAIVLNDLGDLIVGVVNVAQGSAFEMSVSGVSNIADDIKLAAGNNILIQQGIVTSGDVLLSGAGNVTQSENGAVQALGLGLMANDVVLIADNNIDELAASLTGGLIFRNLSDIVVGAVTAADGTNSQMSVSGIVTDDRDVKLASAGNIEINDSIAAGQGSVFLMADSDVAQNQNATISAGALGLRVAGQTNLTGANQFQILAAENGGLTAIRVVNDVVISEVTVATDLPFEMAAVGLSTIDANAYVSVSGDLRLDGSVSVGSGDLVFEVDGNLQQAETIVANALGLIVGGTTELTSENNVEVLAAHNLGGTKFYDVDDLTIGSVEAGAFMDMPTTVSGVSVFSDDLKINIGGNLNIEQTIDGTIVVLDVDGDVRQNIDGTISADSLGLLVDGTTDLSASNAVDQLAARNGNDTVFSNTRDLEIDTVVTNSPLHDIVIQGITLEQGDLKISNFGDVVIQDRIDLAAGNTFLQVDGVLTQSGVAIIETEGLGLMVTGQTILSAANIVDSISADNGGPLFFNNLADLTVSTVSVLPGSNFSMMVSGVVTDSHEVKFQVGGNLSLERDVDAGTQNIFLSVDGNIVQNSTGTLAASGLGLSVNGTTTLDASNRLSVFAAENQGDTIFRNQGDVHIGQVRVFEGTEFEMAADGISIAGQDLVLDVGRDLVIDREIDTAGGNALLIAARDLSQSAAGRISANNLGLDVTGNTWLTASNELATFAANNDMTTVVNHVGDLIIGSATVFEETNQPVQINGVTVSNGDFKLTVAGNLLIEDQVRASVVLFGASGDLTQSNTGQVSAGALALMIDGSTRLNASNVVAQFAADNGGFTLFSSTDDLTIDTVTVGIGTRYEMTVSGLTTSNDNIKIISEGDLILDDAIDIGSADAILISGDNLSQTILDSDGQDGTITAGGLGLVVERNTQLGSTENVFSRLAVENGQSTTATTGSDLQIAPVVVDEMVINSFVNRGNLTLNVVGDLTQSTSITVGGTTSLVVSGKIDLSGADSSGDLRNDNDFVGTVDVVANTHVEIADSNDLHANHIEAGNQIALAAGTGNDDSNGRLSLSGDLRTTQSTGAILLQSTNGIEQDAINGTILTRQLLLGGENALSRSGNVHLLGDNVVSQLAAHWDGALEFTNRRDLEIAPLTFQSQCGAFQESLSGIDVESVILNVTAGDQTQGNLTDAAFAQSTIATTAEFNVANNIELGDRTATLRFTGQRIDQLLQRTVASNFVSISAVGNGAQSDGTDISATANVSLFVDSSIILSDIRVAETLFIDTVESGETSQIAGDILQTMRSPMTSSEILAATGAFVSRASVQLTNTTFEQLAIQTSEASSSLIAPFQLNEHIGSTFTGSLDANVFAAPNTNGSGGIIEVEDQFVANGFVQSNNAFINAGSVGTVVVNNAALILADWSSLGLSTLQLTDVRNTGVSVASLGDVYLESTSETDIDVQANVEVYDADSNITIIAGETLNLGSGVEFVRFDAGTVAGLVNTLRIADNFMLADARSVLAVPGNTAFSDLNAQLDSATGFQTLDFFFGNVGEASFNLIIGWFVVDVSSSEAISASFQSTLLQLPDDVTNDFLLAEMENFGQGVSAYALQITSQSDAPLALTNISEFDQFFFADQSFLLSQVFLTNDSRINLFQDQGMSDLNFAQEVVPSQTVVRNPNVIMVDTPVFVVPDQPVAAPDRLSSFINRISEPESRSIITEQQPESYFLIKFTEDDDGIYEESFKWSDPNDDPDAIRSAIESARLNNNDAFWPDTEDEQNGNWTKKIKDGNYARPGLYFIFEVQEGRELSEPVDAPVDRTDIENLVEPDAEQTEQESMRAKPAIAPPAITSSLPVSEVEWEDTGENHRGRDSTTARFSAATQNALLGSTLLFAQSLIEGRRESTGEADRGGDRYTSRNIFSRGSRIARKNLKPK